MYIIHVNNTLPLALAVHEISRHFWAAYDKTNADFMLYAQEKAPWLVSSFFAEKTVILTILLPS